MLMINKYIIRTYKKELISNKKKLTERSVRHMEKLISLNKCLFFINPSAMEFRKAPNYEFQLNYQIFEETRLNKKQNFFSMISVNKTQRQINKTI